MYPWIWLALFAAMLIVEGMTFSLTTVWFAGGALVTFFVSLFADNRLAEIIVFFAVSLVLIFFVRPSALKRYNRRRTKTNVDTVLGRTVYVIEPINNIAATGRVRLDEMDWAARSVDGSLIPKGAYAEVDKVEGVKLIVRQKV